MVSWAIADGDTVLAPAISALGSGITQVNADGYVVVTGSISVQAISQVIAVGTNPVAPVEGTSTAQAVARATIPNARPTVTPAPFVARAVSNAIVSKRVALTALIADERDAPVEPGIASPKGDRFGDPIVISGSNGEITIDFTGAGVEAGEPVASGVTETVWLYWETDEQDQPRVLFESGVANVRVGTATQVTDFTPIWSGDGSLAAYPQALSFYYIQIGWRPGDPTEFTLVWESEEPPYYDDFATPAELSGDEDRFNMSTDFCTIEASEPVAAGTFKTAWAKWEPETPGQAVISASDPTLTVRVYEDGPDLTALTLITSGVGSATFTAAAQVYLIQICDTTAPGA
jgi:hypothetical protein